MLNILKSPKTKFQKKVFIHYQVLDIHNKNTVYVIYYVGK